MNYSAWRGAKTEEKSRSDTWGTKPDVSKKTRGVTWSEQRVEGHTLGNEGKKIKRSKKEHGTSGGKKEKEGEYRIKKI